MSAEDFEPVPGLPEALPAGERLLWQGSPDWRILAAKAFHWRGIALYFGLLAAWRMVSGIAGGEPLRTSLGALAFLLPIALVVIAIVVGFAVLTARATIYTVTDQRVILRIGIALSMMFNIPFRAIEAASLRTRRDGTGDICLALEPGSRIAFLSLWPHARPWRLKRPEPTLRCIRHPEAVARILAEALAASAGAPVPRARVAATQTSDRPAAGRPAQAALAS